MIELLRRKGWKVNHKQVERLWRRGGAESAKKTAETEKIEKELLAAFGKVEGMKSPSGETYSELFEAHKLPTADGAKSVKEENVTP